MSLAATLLDTQLARLARNLAVEWPGGRAGSAAALVRLELREPAMLGHIAHGLAQGRIGDLAEAYVEGRLDIVGAMPDVMAVAGTLAGDPRQAWPSSGWRRRLSEWQSHWRHRPERDAQQVRAHYNVGDPFYQLWLDPRRVYSCAYYAQPGMTLAQAQEAKLDLICAKLQLEPGLRFLDVGMGWGGLLLWAASRYGVRATGVTLSRNQHAYVQRLVDEAGLSDRVEVKLLDYRDLPAQGQFDRIASVGMFEHVGCAELPRYFGHLRQLLRPGGLVLNHGIAAATLDHAQLGAGIGDFIERHIFPGGELVHVSHALRALAQGGLELLDAENLRPHYARTLWDWSARLEAQLDEAQALAGQATVRAYRLYLAGSAMSFERGWLALYQVLAARPQVGGDAGSSSSGWAAHSDYPFTREHMYR